MHRDELYRVLTLFLVATVVLGSDFSSLAFPVRAPAALGYYVAFLAAILAPSYLLADLILVVLDRLSLYETETG